MTGQHGPRSPETSADPERLNHANLRRVDRALGGKAALAEKVLAETAPPHPARVLVWEGRRTADEDAAHTLTRSEPGP